MIFNMTGGGSAGLNFKIVGSTSQPTNPTENMIWVSTDTPIAGYFFSSAEPEVLTEGMLWFVIGSSSPAAFNALKKNGLMIYLISANQYISGNWERVQANVWQNNEWKDLVTDTVFYKNGTFNTAAFGEITGNVNNNGERLRWTNGNNANATKLFGVDSFDRIEIVIDDASWVAIKVKFMDETGIEAMSKTVHIETSSGAFDVDISEMTGLYYLQLSCSSGNTTTDHANISSIIFRV